jgi:hypothetical protein
MNRDVKDENFGQTKLREKDKFKFGPCVQQEQDTDKHRLGHSLSKYLSMRDIYLREYQHKKKNWWCEGHHHLGQEMMACLFC